MTVLKAWYWALFIFWFRFDLFTKRRKNRFWKAVIAVSLVQLWVILGIYIWVEIIGKVRPPPMIPSLLGVAALMTLNQRMLRVEWDDFDRAFDTYPRSKRRVYFAIGAATTAAAFGFLLVSGIVLRSPR